MNLKIKDLLNPEFDLELLDLSTCIHDIFGSSLSPKLAEFLEPDDDELLYGSPDLSLERLFGVSPMELLHWRNENYPLGIGNTEIDAIGFVLQQTLIFSDEKPKTNRFFAKPYKH